MESKNRFIVSAVVFGAVLSALFFFAFYDALPFIVAESQSMLDAKTKLAGFEEKRVVLLAEQEKLKSLSKQIDAVEAAVVSAKDPVFFLGTLERLARREGLSIDIKPAAPALGSHSDALALTVSVRGALKQGIAFVKDVLQIPFIVSVSDIDVSRSIVFAAPSRKSNALAPLPVAGETTVTVTMLVASRQ